MFLLLSCGDCASFGITNDLSINMLDRFHMKTMLYVLILPVKCLDSPLIVRVLLKKIHDGDIKCIHIECSILLTPCILGWEHIPCLWGHLSDNQQWVSLTNLVCCIRNMTASNLVHAIDLGNIAPFLDLLLRWISVATKDVKKNLINNISVS